MSIRRFVPFHIMSRSAFCTLDIMSIRRFFPFNILSFRHFLRFDILSVDILSHSTFCRSMFCTFGVCYFDLLSVNPLNSGYRTFVANIVADPLTFCRTRMIRNIPQRNKSGSDLLLWNIRIYLINFMELLTNTTTKSTKIRRQHQDQWRTEYTHWVFYIPLYSTTRIQIHIKFKTGVQISKQWLDPPLVAQLQEFRKRG
jgi:hypothetical protein